MTALTGKKSSVTGTFLKIRSSWPVDFQELFRTLHVANKQTKQKGKKRGEGGGGGEDESTQRMV